MSKQLLVKDWLCIVYYDYAYSTAIAAEAYMKLYNILLPKLKY